MYAWAPYGSGEAAGSSLLDRVVIRADKEKYAPGETASVSFRSPFAGNLLVTVDTDRELFRKVIPLDKGEITLDIPLSDEMIPNAYITAWVIRPVQEGEAWGSHRALGTLSVPVERSEKKLALSLEAPAKVLPGEKVKVSGILKDGAGIPRKEKSPSYVTKHPPLPVSPPPIPGNISWPSGLSACRSMICTTFSFPWSPGKRLS